MSEKEINKIFAARLKELLSKKNMTYKEFAEKLDLKPSTISMWNSGRSLPRTEIIVKIAEYFKVLPSYLIGWDTVSDEEIGEVFYNDMQKPITTAAYFDRNEYTEEELDEIRQFAEFVKNRRKNEKKN